MLDFIARYFSRDENYSAALIYDEDLMLTDVVELNNSGEETGRSIIKYDEFGRDTLFQDEYLTIQTSYQWLTDSTLVETEQEKLEYGSELELSRRELEWQNGKLITERRKRYENGMWVNRGFEEYHYDVDGLLKQVTASSERLEYSLRMDTLTEYEYYKRDTTWFTRGKRKYILDRTDGVQDLPLVLSDYLWKAVLQYGRVLEEYSYLMNNEGEMEYYGHDIYHYSAASVLSGNGIVEGYIFDESSTTKSVSITSQKSGDPMPGVPVSLCLSGTDQVLARDTTDANGLYIFRGVPEGKYYLKVEIEGYQQASTYRIQVLPFQTIFENKNFVANNGEVITGIEEFRMAIEVYPNPASDQIRITAGEPIQKVFLCTQGGRMMKRLYEGEENTIDVLLNGLRSGVYILKVQTKTGIGSKKIIKVD